MPAITNISDELEGLRGKEEGGKRRSDSFLLRTGCPEEGPLLGRNAGHSGVGNPCLRNGPCHRNQVETVGPTPFISKQDP